MWRAIYSKARSEASAVYRRRHSGSTKKHSLRLAAYVLFLASLILAGLATSVGDTAVLLKGLFRDNRAPVVILGLLAAVFVCHEPVVRIASRLSGATTREFSSIISIDNAGIYVGWFERALVFAFVASGQSDAAALALAAKSLARQPSIQAQQISGSYFLIGTFASVAAAAGVAIIVRLSLGQTPM